LACANTLAYKAAELITAIISLMIKAPGVVSGQKFQFEIAMDCKIGMFLPDV
jgi:hypothetical protein